MSLGACATDDDGDSFASLTTSSVTLTFNGTDPTGDGDGDPAETSGDGDPGDGDGDPTTGDGDGDPVLGCGWLDMEGYYGCGGSGSDPGGNPIACPLGLVELDPCGDLTGIGCCDGNGDNWYCGDDNMSTYVVKEVCL